MTMTRVLFATVLMLVATVATAEDRETSGKQGAGIWGVDPDATSATLARDGWKFLSMSTMSWPDGRQAVVTLWNSEIGDFARFVRNTQPRPDFFDAFRHTLHAVCIQ